MVRRDVRTVLFAALLAGCALDVGASPEAIIGGEASTLEAAVAVVGRRVTCDETTTPACSGVLIGRRVVLTAAHCVDRTRAPTELEIFFGPDVTQPGTFVAVSDGVIDRAYDGSSPEHDLAILALAEDAPASATPVALPSGMLEDLAAGATLRVAGYGTTDARQENGVERRETTMMLGEVRAGAFDASPAPGSSCRGDSGGPVLATVGGVEELVGITSTGDSACATRATQARVDVAMETFIAPALERFAMLGPAWPTSAIPVVDVDTTACASNAECPALMACDPDTHRCMLGGLGPASFGDPCTTGATCGMGTCARIWPAGPDACRCATATIAPPPPMMGTGGCSVAHGVDAPALGWLVIAAVLAGRRRWAAVGVAAGVAAIAFALWPRSAPPPSVVSAPPETYVFDDPEVLPAPSGTPPSSAPSTTTSERPTVRPEDLVGLTIAEQAALIGDDDISDGLDLPPPALTTEPPNESPPEPEADPAHVLVQREAGLHLLDTTIERLGREADEAEHEHDAEAAARLRVRAARMTELRAQRAEELERLRRGEEVPLLDPSVPGHARPTTPLTTGPER